MISTDRDSPAGFGGRFAEPAKPAPLAAPASAAGNMSWRDIMGPSAEDEATAARRRALSRMLMGGGAGGGEMDPENPAFRTTEGTIGATLAAVAPALAGLAGSLFGGGAGGGMKPWKA
jgi:hypothetical protein